MNKQAILFLVHDNFAILEKMMRLLDSEYFDFFIHVDAASDSRSVEEIITKLKISRAFLIEERVFVRWADYSIVEAELKLMECAGRKGEYTYYHLLSGADFILKTPKETYSFFEEAKDKEFIHSFDISDRKNFYLNRYRYKYRIPYPKKKTLIKKVLYHLYINYSQLWQRLLRKDTREDVVIQLGSQWFSITHHFLEYILESHAKIENIFSYTLVPDESFLQTIAYTDAKIKKKIVSDNTSYLAIKRLIRFEKGKPHVWTIEDKEEILACSAFFIRKLQQGFSDDLVDLLVAKIETEIQEGR